MHITHLHVSIILSLNQLCCMSASCNAVHCFVGCCFLLIAGVEESPATHSRSHGATSSQTQTPFNPPRGKGGLVNMLTTVLYLWNFRGTIWLADMAIISSVLDFLITNHLALLITPLQTYLHVAHLQWTTLRTCWLNLAFGIAHYRYYLLTCHLDSPLKDIV